MSERYVVDVKRLGMELLQTAENEMWKILNDLVWIEYLYRVISNEILKS